MKTASVGPTTSSWPSNSVAVVGEAVLNISPSMNTKPSAPIVYGTPLAKPVMDENVELAVDGVEVLIEIGSISIEDQNANPLARVRWTWSTAKRRTYVDVVLLPSPTGRKTDVADAEVVELGVVRGPAEMKADVAGEGVTVATGSISDGLGAKAVSSYK